MLNRYGIGGATIQIQVPVDLDRLRNQRQGRGGAHSVDVERCIANRQVRGGSEHHIRGACIHFHGIRQIGVIIEGIKAILHVVEHEIVANHAAGGNERLSAHVARIIAKCQVHAFARPIWRLL